MAIDQEIKQRAEELFIIDGLTLADVSAQTDVAERTLANWSKDGQWVERRREYQRASRDIKYYAKMTRLKLIKEAMNSLNPQQVYAFANLERAMSDGENLDSRLRGNDGSGSGNDGGGADIEIKTPQDAINALQEAVELKLRVMLARPEALNLGAIKELKQAMEMIDGMKAKLATKEIEKDSKLQGARAETIDSLREAIMKGIAG